MKTFIYAGAAMLLMSGAAMAQDTNGSSVNPSNPESTVITSDSSVIQTGIAGSIINTGIPGSRLASPSVAAIAPGTTSTSVATGAGDMGAGNDGGSN